MGQILATWRGKSWPTHYSQPLPVEYPGVQHPKTSSIYIPACRSLVRHVDSDTQRSVPEVRAIADTAVVLGRKVLPEDPAYGPAKPLPASEELPRLTFADFEENAISRTCVKLDSGGPAPPAG